MANANTAKETKQITATVDEKRGEVAFAIIGLPSLAIGLSELTPEVARYAALHGLKQKIGDAAAMKRNTETGASATLADKREAMLAVIERLLAGQWNATREGGTGGASLLAAALVRLQPSKTLADVRAWLETKTDAEVKALSLNPKVAPIIAEIRAERAGADAVDSDALLGELGE